MIYLILSILSSTFIVVIFRLFQQFGVNTFQAIVVNYAVCIIVGTIMSGGFPLTTDSFSESWMPYATGLGVLFISGFYAVGMTVSLFGLTVASVLQKMSLAISVPFAILMFSEAAPSTKIIGLVIALLAVVLTNWPKKRDPNDRKQLERKRFLDSGGNLFLIWCFPIYTYLVSGAIEVGLQYVQGSMIPEGDTLTANAFTTAIFANAGTIGILIVLVQVTRGKAQLAWKNIIGGICLGIPNYFSIVFLLLAFSWWDKSIILPINNIIIVALTALIGFFIFSERLSVINVSGVILAIVAILLISWQGVMI